jgi:hypothetical protein
VIKIIQTIPFSINCDRNEEISQVKVWTMKRTRVHTRFKRKVKRCVETTTTANRKTSIVETSNSSKQVHQAVDTSTSTTEMNLQGTIPHKSPVVTSNRNLAFESVATEDAISTLTTVRRLLSSDTKVLSLKDFVTEYAPSLLQLDMIFNQDLPSELLGIIIAPTETCKVLQHVRSADCREPLHSLIDDVVWLLIQRRARCKRQGVVYKNALLQGFAAAREGEVAPSGMRLGVARSHQNSINGNLAYCKTSPIIQQLHSLVGDELFRSIFAHTRLFLPLPDDKKKKRGNYILLCGPTIPSRSHIEIAKISSSPRLKRNNENESKKRKKKRLSTTPNASSTPSQQSLLHPNHCLSRFALFYADIYTRRIGLPPSHPFQPKNKRSPHEILSILLNLHQENVNKQRRIRKRLWRSGLGICHSILNGHTRCDYHRLLDRYCAIPVDILPIMAQKDKNDSDCLARLAKSYIPQDKVVSFLGAVLRRVFPREFWGCEANFLSIVSSVYVFVHLRRKERLSNKILMHGYRVTRMKWLCPLSTQKKNGRQRSSHEATTKLTLTVLRWLFQGYIIPLLRTNFYVTETEFSGRIVHYYRRPMWSYFRSLSLTKMVRGNHFQQLSFPTARSLLTEHRMGLSRLRLLPKATGFRPIAHLSRKQGVHFLWDKDEVPPLRFLPTNVILNEVLDVLRFECDSRERPFGAGISSFACFYPKYREYISRLRQKYARDDLRLFFASVDIEKCFDRINQELLLQFVESLISHNCYIVQQLKLHITSSDDTTVEYDTRIRLKKVVNLLECYQPFHQGKQCLHFQRQHCVFDLSKCNLVERLRILEILREHISSNLVVTSGRFGKKVLQQDTGISQGSTLSTIFCNIYYGKVEESMFGNKASLELRTTEDDFMSRFVDDYLFISTKKENIQWYMSRTYQGVPALGAEVNLDKSSVSDEMTVLWMTATGDVSTSRLPNGCSRDPTGTSLFSWCGLLFNTNNGGVSMDYRRFHGEKPLESLTVDCAGEEGRCIKYRMQCFVFPRCLPILFDSFINSFDNIVINFLQMMLFAAVKTAEYLRSLALMTSNMTQNVDYILNCIEGLPVFAIRNISTKARYSNASPRDFKFELCQSLATWLTWKAFASVFTDLHDFDTLKYGIKTKYQPLDSLRLGSEQNLRLRIAVSRGLDSFFIKAFIRSKSCP